MKQAIIYSRVSTNKQDTSRQINDLKEYAQRNSFEVLEVFTDQTSGKVKAKDRKGIKGMYQYIESNDIDIVLTSEISRLGRSAIDVQNNIHTIVFDKGLNLYIHQQGMTARNKNGAVNSAFKLVSDVLANVAQMEREQISERVKSGLVEAKRKGKTLGRPMGSKKSAAALVKEYKSVVRNLKAGTSIRKTAAICGVSINTVQKVKRAI